MNILDLLDSVVAQQLSTLLDLGRLRYAKSPPEALKQRRSLGIQTEIADFEIIMWESGEVEFGYGNAANSTEEHVEISSKRELDELFARFVETARTWAT